MDGLIATGEAIEYGAEYAYNHTLEGIRDGLQYMEHGIDYALGEEDSSDDEAEEPSLSENQQKCNQIF